MGSQSKLGKEPLLLCVTTQARPQSGIPEQNRVGGKTLCFPSIFTKEIRNAMPKKWKKGSLGRWRQWVELTVTPEQDLCEIKITVES